jgi:hypothetical protein
MPTEQTPPPIDRKRLRSQRLREVNFQGDALRLGMNWTEDDLRKRRSWWKARTGWVTLARFTSAG